MNTLRRVGLVAVSCIILLLSLICPVSAEDELWITRNDFIDMGYLESDDGALYIPRGGYDPLGFYSFVLVSEPNNMFFNPNDIPWNETPQYIKDLISNGFDNVYTLSSDSSIIPLGYKMPFIVALLRTNDVVVYAGYNLCLGVNTLTNSLRVCSTSYVTDCACYSAVYRLSDMALTTPWYQVEGTAWGDTGYIKYYSSSLVLVDGTADMYVFGGNTIRAYAISISVPLSSGNENALFVASGNDSIGFQDGKYFPFQASWTGLYIKYFNPSFFGNPDTGIVDDYDNAEDNLVNGYNPDDLSDDLHIEIDNNAWNAVFQIFNMFVTGNSVVMTLVITMLSLGFIALILNR